MEEKLHFLLYNESDTEAFYDVCCTVARRIHSKTILTCQTRLQNPMKTRTLKRTATWNMLCTAARSWKFVSNVYLLRSLALATYSHNYSVPSHVVFGQNFTYYLILFGQAKFCTQQIYWAVPTEHTQHDRSLAAERLHGQIGTIILLCSSSHIAKNCVFVRVNHTCGSANVKIEYRYCYVQLWLVSEESWFVTFWTQRSHFLRCLSHMPYAGKGPLRLYNSLYSVQSSPLPPDTPVQVTHPSLPNISRTS